jgi:hypothetical protein
MALTEQIRPEIEEFFHGSSPGRKICTKPGKERTVDILSEEDATPVAIQIKGQGTRRMARGVQKRQRFPAEQQGSTIAGNAEYRREWGKGCLVPVGHGLDAVTRLNGLCVIFMHENPASDLFAEIRGPADMVNMPVGQDQRGDAPGIEAKSRMFRSRRSADPPAPESIMTCSFPKSIR